MIFVAETYENILQLLQEKMVGEDRAFITEFRYESSIMEEAVNENSIEKIKVLRQNFISGGTYIEGDLCADIHAFQNIREAITNVLREHDEDDVVRYFGKDMMMLRDDFIEYFSDLEHNNLQDRIIDILDKSRVEL